MEVPLTPFCISWRRGTELFFFHMSPKTDLHLGSESYLCAECLKGRKASVFIAVENLQA